MSYGRPKNVTFIEELPDLDEMDQDPHHMGAQGVGSHQQMVRGMLPPAMANKMSKFMRPNHRPPPQAGMLAPRAEHFEAPPPPPVPPHQVMPQQAEQQVIEPAAAAKDCPSCVDIAGHVTDCPVCSKFYQNDRTVYIIAIVVLSIICILLLKKVLDL